MNSLMTSKPSGSVWGQSVVSSLLFVISATDAVGDDGEGGGESTLCLFGCSGSNDLSSIHIISLALIGVDVTVTDVVGVGFVFFRMGHGGGGRLGVASD